MKNMTNGPDVQQKVTNRNGTIGPPLEYIIQKRFMNTEDKKRSGEERICIIFQFNIVAVLSYNLSTCCGQ